MSSTAGAHGTLPAGRPVAVAAVGVPLELLPAADVVAGAPSAGAVALGELAGAEVGVWQMTEGAARDVEEDEVLVVLSGRATVELEGQAAVELRAGDVMRLESGSRTTWTVHEPLRKVYVTPSKEL